MAVMMSCRAPAARPWSAYVRARGGEILRALRLGGDELSVSLVDDREIRVLNARYRDRDRATDVLAFALTEEPPDAAVPPLAAPARRILGDVVISIDTAAAQARASRCALAARLDALLVHGILHLIGYDHERSPAEEQRMRRKERTVRAALAPRPAPAPHSGRRATRARSSPPRVGARRPRERR